jgi:hypothetical protein
LAESGASALIEPVANGGGDNLSTQELQGKYTVALRRIGGETTSTDRHTPIFQRRAHITEQQAIQEAANALTALWKIRRTNKT